MKLSEQEFYTLLKGLNMISSTDETRLTALEIFKLQEKLSEFYNKKVDALA